MALLAQELGLAQVPVGPFVPRVPESMLKSQVFQTRYDSQGKVSHTIGYRGKVQKVE